MAELQFEIVTVNDRGQEIARRGGTAQSFVEQLPGGVELEMEVHGLTRTPKTIPTEYSEAVPGSTILGLAAALFAPRITPPTATTLPDFVLSVDPRDSVFAILLAQPIDDNSSG